MGINFFYANGYRLEIDSDVTIETNGSICTTRPPARTSLPSAAPGTTLWTAPR